VADGKGFEMEATIFSSRVKGICFAVFVIFPIGGVNAIDFTPHYAQSVQDGFPVNRLYFQDQAQRIYLSVPNGWQVSGDAQRGTFSPKELGQATVILENSPLNSKTAFSGEGLEVYRKVAFGLVPAGASDVHVDFEREGEVKINGWSSFEMAFSYRFYGQSFTSSVLFINLAKDKQIRFRVAARKEHFEKLYPKARATLASWFAPSPELEAVFERLSSRK
jgi:hypothetical protein